MFCNTNSANPSSANYQLKSKHSYNHNMTSVSDHDHGHSALRKLNTFWSVKNEPYSQQLISYQRQIDFESEHEQNVVYRIMYYTSKASSLAATTGF